jgi:hypothetical protein
MFFAKPLSIGFVSEHLLRYTARSATIRNEREEGEIMAKNQTVKTKDTESDPFGSGFTKFVENSFSKSVKAAHEKIKKAGLDCYGTTEGQLAAKKPDGTVVVRTEKNTHG